MTITVKQNVHLPVGCKQIVPQPVKQHLESPGHSASMEQSRVGLH